MHAWLAACPLLRSSFGAKAVDPKPIMKALPALFGHTQAGVRDKAKEVSVELCAYLGQVGAAAQFCRRGQEAMQHGGCSCWRSCLQHSSLSGALTAAGQCCRAMLPIGGSQPCRWPSQHT